MATNHTENYQLNLWEPGDAFLRTEFNENTQKIEEALAARGNCSVVCGSYVGTGEYGRGNPVVLDFADSVGKTPMLIFVSAGANYRLWAPRGAGSYTWNDNPYYEQYCFVEWTETGVQWFSTGSAKNQMNTENMTYYYVVLFG